MANKQKLVHEKNDSPVMAGRPSKLMSICESNTSLHPYCKPGLQAIKTQYLKKIKVPDKKRYGSSIDFDEALKKDFHNDYRWDYGFEYDGNFIFLEFHPAQTSEIDKICKKASFIRNWLLANCPEILNLPKFEKYDRQFYWVATGNNDIRLTPKGSQSKKIGSCKNTLYREHIQLFKTKKGLFLTYCF